MVGPLARLNLVDHSRLLHRLNRRGLHGCRLNLNWRGLNRSGVGLRLHVGAVVRRVGAERVLNVAALAVAHVEVGGVGGPVVLRQRVDHDAQRLRQVVLPTQAHLREVLIAHELRHLIDVQRLARGQRQQLVLAFRATDREGVLAVLPGEALGGVRLDEVLALIAVREEQVDLPVGVHVEQVDVGVLAGLDRHGQLLADVVAGVALAALVAVRPDLHLQVALVRVDDDALRGDLGRGRGAVQTQGGAQAQQQSDGQHVVLVHGRTVVPQSDRRLNREASAVAPRHRYKGQKKAAPESVSLRRSGGATPPEVQGLIKPAYRFNWSAESSRAAPSVRRRWGGCWRWRCHSRR